MHSTTRASVSFLLTRLGGAGPAPPREAWRTSLPHGLCSSLSPRKPPAQPGRFQEWRSAATRVSVRGATGQHPQTGPHVGPRAFPVRVPAAQGCAKVQAAPCDGGQAAHPPVRHGGAFPLGAPDRPHRGCVRPLSREGPVEAAAEGSPPPSSVPGPLGQRGPSAWPGFTPRPSVPRPAAWRHPFVSRASGSTHPCPWSPSSPPRAPPHALQSCSQALPSLALRLRGSAHCLCPLPPRPPAPTTAASLLPSPSQAGRAWVPLPP